MLRSKNLLFKFIISSALVYCLFVFRYGELVNHTRIRYSQHTGVNNLFISNSDKINSTRLNEWTVMLSVNNGYQDFFLNWLTAYRKSNLTYSIIVIAEDQYLFTNIYRYKTEGMRIIESEFPSINASVNFGSREFNELSVRRHTYILRELEKGSNIIFSDTDTVWLKDPIPYFTGNYDIWMQTDNHDSFCPGSMAVKSTEVAISFFKNLTRGLSLHPQADQPLINKLIRNSNIRVAGLPTKSFPSGVQYFREFSSVERSKAVVVHNNYMKGHNAKVNRFRKFNLWFLKR